MRRYYLNCAYCSKKIEVREWMVFRPRKSTKVRKIFGGFVITDLFSQLGTPICNDHYKIIAKILTTSEIYFRNAKGQFQRFI